MTSLFLTAVSAPTLVQEAKNPPCAAVAALKSWDGHWHSCPGKWWSLHPWKGSKAVGMWHLGTWVRGGLGRAGGMVGLDDRRGFSNLNNSVIVTGCSAFWPQWAPQLIRG